MISLTELASRIREAHEVMNRRSSFGYSDNAVSEQAVVALSDGHSTSTNDFDVTRRDYDVESSEGTIRMNDRTVVIDIHSDSFEQDLGEFLLANRELIEKRGHDKDFGVRVKNLDEAATIGLSDFSYQPQAEHSIGFGAIDTDKKGVKDISPIPSGITVQEDSGFDFGFC